MRRRAAAALALLAAAAATLGLGACGGNDTPAPPAKPVRLTIESPADAAQVQTGTVTLRGSVSPASAQVQVRGRRAEVSGGRFRASVALEPGTNVIDVMASAGDSAPAFAALRVTRQRTARVPDLSGATQDEAMAALEDIGLKANITHKGGIFERLIPRGARVCETSPEAGETVVRGTTVDVLVGRLC